LKNKRKTLEQLVMEVRDGSERVLSAIE